MGATARGPVRLDAGHPLQGAGGHRTPALDRPRTGMQQAQPGSWSLSFSVTPLQVAVVARLEQCGAAGQRAGEERSGRTDA
jgi:hypothetical protein